MRAMAKKPSAVFASITSRSNPSTPSIDMTLLGGLSGLDVARELWALHPGCGSSPRSGHSEDDAVLPEGSPFVGLLPKPYGMEKLSEALEVAVS